MAKPQAAWLLWREARRWSLRPSDLLGLDDRYIGYCFDQAIGFIGETIDNELEEIENDSKASDFSKTTRKQNVLKQYFGEAWEPRGQYADPVAMAGVEVERG